MLPSGMKFIGRLNLAESEMNAARFNIQRRSMVIAAERAQWVIEHYPQTPQAPEALRDFSLYGYQNQGSSNFSAIY